ncbi:hypothetical protein NUW58_g6111 [Xylaria curta]|uniref:Uncharacterized protein n=1 Tax=Xylaria curta TaxID=42375 RepID=A0ACC1NY56_9PEZI|nr:hypothetical protein NUW58_g6111 [Xylaria curta]
MGKSGQSPAVASHENGTYKVPTSDGGCAGMLVEGNPRCTWQLPNEAVHEPVPYLLGRHLLCAGVCSIIRYGLEPWNFCQSANLQSAIWQQVEDGLRPLLTRHLHALFPVQCPAPKKKSNKKKKNAAKPKPVEDGVKAPEIAKNGESHDDDGDQSDDNDEPAEITTDDQKASANGHTASPSVNGHPYEHTSSDPDTTARLDAMTKEREALKAEVEGLRKQLENLNTSHVQETTQLKSELEEVEAAKEQVEEQYQTLVGRVEKIKEGVGNRLARGKEELEEANQRIEELEAQNEDLQKSSNAFQEEITGLKTELQDATRELSSLRSRNNLSQQNSLKEKEDMARQIQHFREEAEAAKDAMGDWEVLAMEERSIRESLAEKTTALEEQIESLRENYERAASERDTQSQAVDSLQRALQEIQEARKRELREMVETSEEQHQAMKKLVREADARASEAETARSSLQKELERTAPFEKEVKEKNLLIGKLRHEAIVLNDHLTKALRYLKKTKPEESIDRQIVTNHFLQFLALDRSDPKKFQILQIIAGLLNWTDEQREQAGLARPGASNNSLRLPTSPFHRTPSTPSLNTEFFSEPTPTSASKESLADLWAGFLERSVEEGAQAPSRKAIHYNVPLLPRYRRIQLRQHIQGVGLGVARDILDMTGRDQKLLTSSSGLLTPTAGGSELVEQTEARKLARRAQGDLAAFVEEWKTLEERKAWLDMESLQRQQEVDELESEFSSLQVFSLVLDEVYQAARDQQWDPVISELKKAEISASTYNEELSGIAVASIHPFLANATQGWQPLEDPNLGNFATDLVEIKKLVGIQSKTANGGVVSKWGHDELDSSSHFHARSTTPYESMIYKLVFPKLVTTISQTWDVYDATPLLAIFDRWEQLFPAFIRSQLLEQVVRRLESTVASWKPKKERRESFPDSSNGKIFSALRSHTINGSPWSCTTFSPLWVVTYAPISASIQVTRSRI